MCHCQCTSSSRGPGVLMGRRGQEWPSGLALEHSLWRSPFSTPRAFPPAATAIAVLLPREELLLSIKWSVQLYPRVSLGPQKKRNKDSEQQREECNWQGGKPLTLVMDPSHSQSSRKPLHSSPSLCTYPHPFPCHGQPLPCQSSAEILRDLSAKGKAASGRKQPPEEKTFGSRH